MKLLAPALLASSTYGLSVERHGDSTDELDLQKWWSFKSKFNKKYDSTEEHDSKFQTFRRHLRKFELHNADKSKTYKMGINQFTDLTWEEFSQAHLMQKKLRDDAGEIDHLPYPEEANEFECPKRFDRREFDDMDPSFEKRCDWRDPEHNPKGRVADVGVKNQASCGSCYAFSAVAAMEGSLCMQGLYDCSTWVGLSEQQILNCGTYDEKHESRTWEYFHGCSGGWQSNVYQHIYRAGGITCGHMGPYESGNSTRFPDSKYNVGTCPYTWETQYEWMQGASHAYVLKDICGTTNKGGVADAEDMKHALYHKGPLAIGMYVGDNFRHVHSGIYIPDDSDSADCPNLLQTGINHAMTAVAYRTSIITDEDGDSREISYWVIKNSWDTTFAQDGYVNVVMGSNACGIEGNISYVDMARAENEDDDDGSGDGPEE